MANPHSADHDTPAPRTPNTAQGQQSESPHIPRCFVAYPSSPPDRAESIETAIRQIHDSGVVDIIGWRNLAVGGRLMISVICNEIKDRDIFVADVTGLNPNVLFELGYAIALGKPICMISSDRPKYPFDVQHRKIVIYSKQATPSEFEDLQERITATLKARLADLDAFETNKEAVEALSNMPETEGLKPHEMLALTIAMQNHFTGGIGPWQMQKEMQKAGFIAAASSLALMGLKRKGLVTLETRMDANDEYYEAIVVSEKGEDWLITNQEKLNLKLPGEPEGRKGAVEIRDEDIPF